MRTSRSTSTIPVPHSWFRAFTHTRAGYLRQHGPRVSWLFVWGELGGCYPFCFSGRNKKVFLRLREEHFEKFLLKIKVGDHAIFLQLWETKANVFCEVFA